MRGSKGTGQETTRRRPTRSSATSKGTQSKAAQSPSRPKSGDVLAAGKGKSTLARVCARRPKKPVGDGGRELRRGLGLREEKGVTTLPAPSLPRDRRDPMATPGGAMYVAFELSASTWKLLFGNGAKTRMVTLDAGDLSALEKALALAREKLGVAKKAPVYSCYEAGRDGFWLHRWLEAHEVRNRVVDPSAIQVSRRAKHVKTDKVDVKKLLSMLIRDVGGECDVWRTCRVPTPVEEDERQPQRELQALKEDRTRVSNQIRALLVRYGIRLKPGTVPRQPDRLRGPSGEALLPRTREQLRRHMAHYELLANQIREVEHERVMRMRKALQVMEETPPAIKKASRREPGRYALNDATPTASTTEPVESEPQAAFQRRAAQQALQLMSLKGIGMTSAWSFCTEFFAWRRFRNRREVGAAAGLDGTPFNSGTSEREQGISKAGNRRIRSMAVEIAWEWLRYQPNSSLSRWFSERVGNGAIRKKTITAMARRLLVALWRFLEQGVVPEGAEFKQLIALR